jgi:hypothetical protein
VMFFWVSLQCTQAAADSAGQLANAGAGITAAAAAADVMRCNVS